VQADFKGWQLGRQLLPARLHTDEDVGDVHRGRPPTIPCDTTADFGPFIPTYTNGGAASITTSSPSANLRQTSLRNLVARFAAAETMTRADTPALCVVHTPVPAGHAGPA